MKGGVLDYNAGWGLEMCGELTENSSTFAVNQYICKSVFYTEALTLEEDSASVVFISYS